MKKIAVMPVFLFVFLCFLFPLNNAMAYDFHDRPDFPTGTDAFSQWVNTANEERVFFFNLATHYYWIEQGEAGSVGLFATCGGSSPCIWPMYDYSSCKAFVYSSGSWNCDTNFSGGAVTKLYMSSTSWGDHVLTNVDLHNLGSPYNLMLETNWFPPSALTIVLSPQEGGGVVSLPQGDGIYCGVDNNTICQLNFDLNSEVELEAYPNDGYVFVYWDNGTAQFTDNPHTFTMDGNMTVTAVFRLLSFPLSGYTPYDAPISSVFDHSGTAQYSDSDHQVIAFNGEASDSQTNYNGTTCYSKTDNSVFGSGFNYDGISGAGSYYLCYNGHPGIDYPIANNTPVYAAADGIAHIPSSFPGVSNAQTYNTVEIDHQNGYKTYYLHLSSQNVTENQQVYKGQTIIGYSGDTGASGAYHLHFEVQKLVDGNGIPVDPYGWTGNGTDPYTRATNIALWE
jgi:hypothetical protein